MRAVLDNNVLISASINPRGAPAQIVDAWRSRAFEIIVSPELLLELEHALSYPRVRRYSHWSDSETYEFLQEVERFSSLVKPAERLAVVRDPADDMLLEAAIAGEADYIVSVDKDLLDLGRYQGIEIVTPARFAVILNEAMGRLT